MQEFASLAAKHLLADRDSNLLRAVDETLTQKYRESHTPVEGRKKFMLRIALTAEERDTLSQYFPEVEITYHNNNLYSHGYAAASRKLETEILLARASGTNEPLIDIGGNWAEHLVMKRGYIHSCCPILDPRDSARHDEREKLVQKVYKTQLNHETSASQLSRSPIHQYLMNNKKPYCNKLAQNCTYKAKRGIALHSIYDIKFDDLGKIMDSHGMDTLHGSFIFFPAILNKTHDGQPLESKELQVVAIKYLKEDAIEFTFKSDASNCYRHKYSQYIEYVRRTFTVYRGSLFYYELMENRGGIQFFKLIRCKHTPIKPIANQAKYIWMGNDEIYAVKVYDYATSLKKLGRKDPTKELTVDYVFVDKLSYERALEYALGIDKEGTPFFNAIYTYMRSINNRVIVNGVNVTTPKRVNADALYRLSTAIYCHAVFMKYCGNQVRERLERQTRSYFNLLKSGFWSLLGQWLRETVSLPGDALHDHTIGPFREAMLNSMSAVKNRPEYAMQDFYIRFEDYVDLSLEHDKEVLRKAGIELKANLLKYYQLAKDLQFTPELANWLKTTFLEVSVDVQQSCQFLKTKLDAYLKQEGDDEITLNVTTAPSSSTPTTTSVTTDNNETPTNSVTPLEEVPQVPKERKIFALPQRRKSPKKKSEKSSIFKWHLPVWRVKLSKDRYAESEYEPPIVPKPESFASNLSDSSSYITVAYEDPPENRVQSWVNESQPDAISMATEVSENYLDQSLDTHEQRSETTCSASVVERVVCNNVSENIIPRLADVDECELSIQDDETECEESLLAPPSTPEPFESQEEPLSLVCETGKNEKTAEESQATEETTHETSPESVDPAQKVLDTALCTITKQDPRPIMEFVSYLKAEYQAMIYVGRKIWGEVFSSVTNHPQTTPLSAANQQHEAAVLVRMSNGIYKPYQPLLPSITMACGDYDMAFDGSVFLDCESRREGWRDFYSVDSISNYLIVWKDTRLLQCVHLLKAIANNAYVPNDSAVITLVEGVPGCGKTTEIINRAKGEDLILTVARKTKEEIVSKLGKHQKTKVRTVDSYVLNDRGTYERVFLDEGLMIHAGMIDLIANYSCCKQLLIYGDRNQLNFTSRVTGFKTLFHVRKDYHSYEMRNLSYRCPVDVTRLFKPVYIGGFDTTNKVLKSMSVTAIHNLSDVPKTFEKYLVFTQEEKKDLLKEGFKNVNTIHESQGTTYGKVALVRFNYKQLDIFNKVKYILVGLTRHTKELTYFTKRVMDTTHALMTGVRIVHEADMKDTLPDFDRFIKGLRPSEMYLSVEEQQYKACEGDVMDLRTKVTETEHFKVSENTGLFTQLKTIDPLSVFRPKIDASKKGKAVLDSLQTYYDSVLNEASTSYLKHDEYQVQHNDLSLNLENLKFNLARDGEKIGKVMKETTAYEPVLRTGQPNKRVSDLRQALLAISKRNCDTPKNALPSDFPILFARTLNSMRDLFFRPDAAARLNEYMSNPIAVTPEGLEQWLSSQEPSKLKRINVEEELVNLGKITEYHMMVKSQAKNKLEPSAVFEYQSPQNIVYHESSVNAIFGPMFKILFQRFVNLLAPNVCVMLQKSHQELENHLTSNLDPSKEYSKLEIDFSKFDKSQTEICFEMEMAIWSLLGMDQYLHDLWKIGHYTVSATDFAAGVKAYLLYQRKSGDSATAFGNTIVSMATVAYSACFPYVEAAYFIGDDSLIFLDQKYNHASMPDTLLKTFNLTAKIIELETGYFCSMFVIQSVDSFKVIPDPLKRIEKLGALISVNDEEDLRQRYVSFKELIDPLSDDTLFTIIAKGMDERYGPSDHTISALQALRVAASDFRIFSTLYQKVVY